MEIFEARILGENLSLIIITSHMQNIFQLNPLVTTCRLKSSSSYERIKTQTGDSALVQSKSTKMIYINSIRIIKICDRDNLEGYSKAKLSLSKNNKALFQGYLSQKLPKDGIIKNTGYINLRSPRKYVSY
jgi:hypothetical protein